MEQHSLKCLHLVSWQKNGIQGEAGSATEKDGKKKYDTLAARRGDSPERERIKHHKDWQRFGSTTVRSPVAEKTDKQ